jgi:hypothetical protein
MASVKFEADAIQPDRRGAVVLRGSEPTCNRGSRPTTTSTQDTYHPSDIWPTAACAGETEREAEREAEGEGERESPIIWGARVSICAFILVMQVN